MTFAQKMPEIYMTIARKILFPIYYFFEGGGGKGHDVSSSLFPRLHAYIRYQL